MCPGDITSITKFDKIMSTKHLSTVGPKRVLLISTITYTS